MKRPYHQYPFNGYPTLNGVVWGTIGGIVVGLLMFLALRWL